MPVWGTVLVAFGAAFFGAFVGAASSWLLELWRQVIKAYAASQIIRSELNNNNVYTAHILRSGGPGAAKLFENEAWRELRTTVGPFLDEGSLTYITSVFAYIPFAQANAQALAEPGFGGIQDPAGWLRIWHRQILTAQFHLSKFESTARLVLFMRLIVRTKHDQLPTLEELEGEAKPWVDQMVDVVDTAAPSFGRSS